MFPFSAVLLVDDDPSTNFLNEATLYGLQLTGIYHTVRNGAEALTALQDLSLRATTEHPVLVLLDMAMPVMDGMGFLEAFQHLPAAVRASTVLVVLAVSMTSADLARLGDYPVAGLVSKPLTSEKLTPIVQLYLAGRVK